MILFFGPAGSGKTTQAKILAEKYHWNAVSAGTLLREEAKNNLQLQQILDGGQPAPFDFTNQLLFAKIDQDQAEHIIIDGFPRFDEQLQPLLERYGSQKIFAVIVLELSENEASKRMRLRGRDDDTDKSIKQRFNLFNTQTKSVIQHLTQLGCRIIYINGNQSVQEIADEIDQKIHQDFIKMNGNE